MTVHTRKHKQIIFDLAGVQYQCQVKNWNMNNNTPDGDKLYALCPDGETQEETDPDWSLDVEFYSDWRVNGISDYLALNNGVDVNFQVDQHPQVPAEHVFWTGNLRIKSPSVGGEARATETQKVTFKIKGEPVYSRP